MLSFTAIHLQEVLSRSLSSGRLKPLDIEFMKQLHNKVNIVPVIAKADCLTKKEVQRLKSRVMEEIEREGIKIYPLPDCDSDEDEDYKEQVLGDEKDEIWER